MANGVDGRAALALRKGELAARWRRESSSARWSERHRQGSDDASVAQMDGRGDAALAWVALFLGTRWRVPRAVLHGRTQRGGEVVWRGANGDATQGKGKQGQWHFACGRLRVGVAVFWKRKA